MPTNTFERVCAVVDRFTAPEHRRFVVREEYVGLDLPLVFLQVEGKVRDLTDPRKPSKKRSWQRGARQLVDRHATDSDIFRMMLWMLLAFEEHEIREAVLVDGERVFGPHITVDALKSVAESVEI